MELTFINDFEAKYDAYEEKYLHLFSKILKKLRIKANYIVEVNLINNEEIRSINKQYRHIDAATDVISFAFLDEVEGELHISGDVPILLGEIFISVDKALEQATNYQHTIDREMSFLFVHGLLHLLGYDHQNEEQEKIMFNLQEDILKKEI